MEIKKRLLLVLIIFLAIGFATVSTTLVINGVINLASNKDDFNVIFTSAKLNGNQRNDFIDKDTKKSITYETNRLINLNEESVLDYEVTNTSKNYDADVVINCMVLDNEFITIDYEPKNMIVSAGNTKNGTVTAKLIKVSTEDKDIKVTCTLTATALERSVLGSGYVESGVDYLSFASEEQLSYDFYNQEYGSYENIEKLFYEACEDEETEMCYAFQNDMNTKYEEYMKHHKLLWENIDKRSIDSINIVKSKELPDGVIEYWDASYAQNGSIMAYTLDENNDGMYELYLGQDGGVVANPNSSDLFYEFSNVTLINGLNNLDTSNVTSMEYMFLNCSNLIKLDLSNFNTSKATNMHQMFYNCSNLIELDLSSFNTSKVTNMSNMFSRCIKLTRLDLRNFTTDELYNINYMFDECNNLLELNISSFDFSNITDLTYLFSNNPSDAQIIVKDKAAQDWILGLNNADRPSSWTEKNVIIENKEAV